MTYDSRPDADHIQKFAQRMKTFWDPQSKLDDRMIDYLLMRNKVDVAADPKSRKPAEIKAFRAGLGGLLVKEDAALITVTPGIHINPPTDSEVDKTHASEVLEPWLTGAWKLSQQAGQVWYRQPGDLRGVGRSWSNVYPHPSLWAEDGYRKTVQRYNDSDDPEERTALGKEIEAFKRDNWPIRWRYVSPLNTWAMFNGTRWLPEVIEIRKMTGEQIEDEYGSKYLPAGQSRNGSKATTIDVYEWANWAWCATIIGDKSEPKIAHQFEHGLGCSPYILAEAELLPAEVEGLRWAGALFYAEDMLDTYDEIMSDARVGHRRWTRAPVTLHLDKETYSEDEKIAGRPPMPNMDGEFLAFWKDEELRAAPVPQITAASIQLLQEVKAIIQQSMIRPVERGQALSGTSNNMFTTQVQIAEREYDPSMKALNLAGEGFCLRAMRCVLALNREYPDDPDKVYVYGDFKGKGAIGVGPKDVRGWENAVQVRSSRAIPIDRLVQMNTIKGMLDVGLPMETAYEQEGGFENPQAQIRKKRLETLAEAAFDQAVQQVQLRVGAKLQQASPEELQRIQELMAGASPALQQVLSGQMPPQGPGTPGTVPGSPGAFQQAMSNVARTGSPQAPQMPTESVMGGMTP